jgi:hypothetical protein
MSEVKESSIDSGECKLRLKTEKNAFFQKLTMIAGIFSLQTVIETTRYGHEKG